MVSDWLTRRHERRPLQITPSIQEKSRMFPAFCVAKLLAKLPSLRLLVDLECRLGFIVFFYYRSK